VNGAGTPAELRELVRRHRHHYWRHLPANTVGVIDHVLGHALDGLSPDHAYVLTARGFEGTGQRFELSVWVSPTHTLATMPPVPDTEVTADGSA